MILKCNELGPQAQTEFVFEFVNFHTCITQNHEYIAYTCIGPMALRDAAETDLWYAIHNAVESLNGLPKLHAWGQGIKFRSSVHYSNYSDWFRESRFISENALAVLLIIIVIHAVQIMT